MTSTAASDAGEKVFTTEELDHAHLLDTTPPPTHGGAVCREPADAARLRHTSMHPELLIMPQEHWEPSHQVPPKVWVDEVTWGKGVRLMLHSDIACGVPEGSLASADVQAVEQRRLAVGKPGMLRGTGPQRL